MTEPFVVLVGATGDLGGRIARALVQQGTPTRALVRREGTPLPAGVEAVTVNFSDVPGLTAACRGASCIVSTVNGLEPVVLDLQGRLLDAAVAADVPRFIPSDFSLDFTRTRPGDNRNLDLRRAFMRRLDAAPIRATSVLNGAFAELLTSGAPIVLPGLRRVLYWGDTDQPLDFTTKDDIAAFTARVSADADTPRFMRIAGDSISARGLATIMTDLTGKRFKLLRGGGLGRLDAIIRVARALTPRSDAVFPAWQGMQYLRDMASGRGRLAPLDNDRYPGSRWTSARNVLAGEV